MRLDVDIKGVSKLARQLTDLHDDADAVIVDVISTLVTETKAEAVRGIQGGPASGRVYEKYSPRRTHQASAPGQYPATDTGRLASSIEVNMPTRARLMGEVGTAVMYGRHLEFGTSRMAARPWLMPSFEKAKIGVEQRLKAALEARV